MVSFLYTLYKVHDELTDKKIFGAIAPEEKDRLEKIRKILESQDKDLIIEFDKKIEHYEEILAKPEELELLLQQKIY